MSKSIAYPGVIVVVKRKNDEENVYVTFFFFIILSVWRPHPIECTHLSSFIHSLTKRTHELIHSHSLFGNNNKRLKINEKKN